MPCDLNRFGASDMSRCGSALRSIGVDARDMEEVANRIVEYLRHELVDGAGETPACPLVRVYTTQRYDALDDDQQQFVTAVLDGAPAVGAMECLTLLATAGEDPAWNARTTSRDHKAMPLATRDMVERAPMIAGLIAQFGLELGVLLAPRPEQFIEAEQRTYNVFHVPEALGSPLIPAQQEFVVPCRIRSVLGFGGMLPSGSLFAVILFSRVAIARETAVLFRPLALDVKLALLPFVGDARFG